MEGCTGDLEGGGDGVVRRENTSAEGSELEWFLDDDSFDRVSMIESLSRRQDFSPYRLCVGVVYLCGVRLGFELGVEVDSVFRLLLGVFGSSTSLVCSHCRSQLSALYHVDDAYIGGFLLGNLIFSFPLPRGFCLTMDTLN